MSLHIYFKHPNCLGWNTVRFKLLQLFFADAFSSLWRNIPILQYSKVQKVTMCLCQSSICKTETLNISAPCHKHTLWEAGEIHGTYLQETCLSLLYIFFLLIQCLKGSISKNNIILRAFCHLCSYDILRIKVKFHQDNKTSEFISLNHLAILRSKESP